MCGMSRRACFASSRCRCGHVVCHSGNALAHCRAMSHEAEDAGPARVVPLQSLSVVTQPGSVKILHRSGRVVWTFTGEGMKAEGLLLSGELLRVFGDEKLLAREGELKKPWWNLW